MTRVSRVQITRQKLSCAWNVEIGGEHVASCSVVYSAERGTFLSSKQLASLVALSLVERTRSLRPMIKTITTGATMVAVAAAQAGGSGPSQNQNLETQAFLDELNQELPKNYLYSLTALAAVVFLYRTSLRINSHIRNLASLDGSVGAPRYFAETRPTVNWLKAHLLYAPLFRQRRAREIKLGQIFNLGTLPTRLQALFIASCLAVNVFACVWNIPWSSPELQVLPILGSRTGTLAVANLVPIVVMATVKNPLINTLEISYDSFNLMHRWLGRISILQGITHTLCEIISTVMEGGWAELFESFRNSAFIYTGLIAVIGFTVIAFQAPKLVRSLAYEFFLHFHIALVAMTFGGLYMHLKEFPQLKFLQAAIVIWAATRGWRGATMIYRSCGRGGCKVMLNEMPDGAVRVDFTSPRPWHFKPGQSLYLCVPSVGWWTFHPFSVAWGDSDNGSSILGGEEVQGEKFQGRVTIGEPRDRDLEKRGTTNQTMSLLIKQQNGFTKSLYQRARKQAGLPLTLSALVEGPYGHEESLSSYGTVVLFAGGVGITHQMPYVRTLLQDIAEGTVATRKIVFVWVVPNLEDLDWVRPWMNQVLGMEKRREVLKILFFITKATIRQDIRTPNETVVMVRGRPDVVTILSDACKERIGCVGVSVCAGGGLADEVRKGCRLMLGMGVNLDFVEEGFGW